MEKKVGYFVWPHSNHKEHTKNIKEKITVPVYHNKKSKQKRSHGEIKYDKITKKIDEN